jgi:hypothetical protein
MNARKIFLMNKLHPNVLILAHFILKISSGTAFNNIHIWAETYSINAALAVFFLQKKISI